MGSSESGRKSGSARLRLYLKNELFASEEGSAILEFVAIAIPLLIPLMIYLGVLEGKVQESFALHNLARQAARAFISSPGEALAPSRAHMVLTVPQASHVQRSSGKSIEMTIECEATPCLTPDSRVTVTLKLVPNGLEVSNTQIVDAWR